MKSNNVKHLFFTLLALLPLLYLGLNWEQMPEQVATHFAADGTPNGYTSKSSLWGFVGFMSGITIVSYYLTQYIDVIDPKRRGKPVPPIFNKVAITLVLFLTGISLLILTSALHPEENIAGRAMIPAVGLLLAVLGNYMHNIKHNYFVGIKVPWALASEYNWRKTHQLAGWLWMAGGILVLLSSLLLPREAASVAFQVLIGIMVIVPAVYSFMLFKREGKQPHYYDKA